MKLVWILALALTSGCVDSQTKTSLRQMACVGSMILSGQCDSIEKRQVWSAHMKAALEAEERGDLAGAETRFLAARGVAARADPSGNLEVITLVQLGNHYSNNLRSDAAERTLRESLELAGDMDALGTIRTSEVRSALIAHLYSSKAMSRASDECDLFLETLDEAPIAAYEAEPLISILDGTQRNCTIAARISRRLRVAERFEKIRHELRGMQPDSNR